MRRALVGLVVLAACTGAREKDRVAVNTALAQDLTSARYQEFATRAHALADQASAFCGAPDQAGLDATRQAWWDAKTPWKQVDIVQFGPVVEYPERLGPKLDDWPASVDSVQGLVDGEADLAPEAFASMGTATRGLPVIEVLLWHGDDPLADLSTVPRRCQALVGSTADVATSADALVVAWRDDWMPRLVEPASGDSDAYDTTRDVLDEWVNRMIFTIENIRVGRLGKPVGDDSGGEPQPDALEARWSGRSLQDARDALDGVRVAWDGVEPGVRDLVKDETLAGEIDALFDLSIQRLGEVPEPLSQTIVLEPEIVARAQEPLLDLQVALQVELAQELSVTITFNDNDGD